MTPYETTLNLRLVNPTNDRGHWGKEAGRADKQTRKVIVRLANARMGGAIPPAPPFRVTITRLYPPRAQPMDKDNLAAACKHVQDAIATTLGVDDGDKKAFDPHYRQERAEKYGVRIRIERKP